MHWIYFSYPSVCSGACIYVFPMLKLYKNHCFKIGMKKQWDEDNVAFPSACNNFHLSLLLAILSFSTHLISSQVLKSSILAGVFLQLNLPFLQIQYAGFRYVVPFMLFFLINCSGGGRNPKNPEWKLSFWTKLWFYWLKKLRY